MERDARVMPRAGAVNVTDEVPLPVEDLIVGDREDDALALELLELVVLEVLVSDAGDPDVLSELREPMLSGVSLEEGHGERLLEARRARLRDAVVAESPLRVNVRLTRVEDTNLRAVVQAQRAAQGLVRLTGVQDRGAVAELHRALEAVLGGGRRRRNQRQREEGRQQARHRGGGVEEVWEGAGRSVKGVHERGRGAAGLNGGRCKPGRQVFFKQVLDSADISAIQLSVLPPISADLQPLFKQWPQSAISPVGLLPAFSISRLRFQ